MVFQIRITEAALADFEGILTYSWDNFPATAEPQLLAETLRDFFLPLRTVR